MDIAKYNKVLRRCIQDCMNCMTKTARTPDKDEIAACCIECVQMCEITSKALMQNSKFTAKYMDLCADICNWCAILCQELPYAECQSCAISCKECAKMLRKERNEKFSMKNKQVPYSDSNPGTLWY